MAATQDNRVAVIDLGILEVADSFEPGLEPDGMAWVNGGS